MEDIIIPIKTVSNSNTFLDCGGFFVQIKLVPYQRWHEFLSHRLAKGFISQQVHVKHFKLLCIGPGPAYRRTLFELMRLESNIEHQMYALSNITAYLDNPE